MNDPDERWDLVGAALAARVKALGLTKAQVIREAGVSSKSLDGYLAGAPIRRVDKKTSLCRALGWTIDSVDLILAGHEPRLAWSTDPTPPGGGSAVPAGITPLDPDEAGALQIAALAGRLTPEQLAKVEGFILGLLDSTE